jgi:opacity protein-like surface antigen
MKKAVWGGLAAVVLSGTAMAGGNIAPVEAAAVPVVQENEENRWYAGGALYYNRVYSVDNGWFDDNTRSQDEQGELTAIVGYEYNEYLAFEARASLSLFQEDYAETYNYSFLLKPQYKFKDEANYNDDYVTLYGLIGFGYVNVEGTDGDTPAAPETVGKTLTDDWQFQYGIGLSYTFVDEDHPQNSEGDWTLFVEYMMHMDDQSMDPARLYDYDETLYDELSMDSLNVGVLYHF